MYYPGSGFEIKRFSTFSLHLIKKKLFINTSLHKLKGSEDVFSRRCHDILYSPIAGRYTYSFFHREMQLNAGCSRVLKTSDVFECFNPNAISLFKIRTSTQKTENNNSGFSVYVTTVVHTNCSALV